MILCVDDEPIGLSIRKILLEREGYEVLVATSGREALNVFASSPIEAVVLDYSMPEMNGGEVAAELKRLNPRIPILMLSAYIDLPEEALKSIDACALKGESPACFLAVLKELVTAEQSLKACHREHNV